jgi:CheY-like chemotaxis protein
MVSREGQHFVLMAEDDPDDRLLYEEALQKSDFKVSYHISADGLELVKFLKEKGNPRPSIILVDLRMPGMNAHEIIATVKGDPELQTIPVIVFTGADQESEVRKVYAESAKGYIIKPTGFDALIQTLNEIFSYWFRTVRLPNEE